MRISRWGGAAVLGFAVALAWAAPAAAQDAHFPADGWQVRDIGLGETDWREGAAAASSISSSTVELTKPSGDVGTSAETADVGLEVAAGDAISVDYELLEGALPDAGAVRLFYYSSPDADTLGVAPTATAVADALEGTLTITVTDGGTVGTLGMTYDASNSSAGTVRFSSLMVGSTPILFLEPTPEPSPTAEPTAEPTKPADPQPTDPAAPGQGGGGDKPGLPVTGVSMPVVAGIGVALLAGGGGLWWLGRRRRGVSFTA